MGILSRLARVRPGMMPPLEAGASDRAAIAIDRSAPP